MFLWRNDFKRFVVSEYCKYHVAYFVWYNTHCHKFWFWLAFFQIVITQNWIFSISSTGCTDALQGQRVNNASCYWWTPFGHFNLGSFKFAGLLYSGIKTKVSKKLFGFWKCWKINNLTHEGYCRKKIGTFESFNQVDLFYKIGVFISINEFMHLTKDVIDLFIILGDETKIQPNTCEIAANSIAKHLCLVCCLNNGMILVFSIGKSKPCCGADGINDILLISFHKCIWSSINLQQSKWCVGSNFRKDTEILWKYHS